MRIDMDTLVTKSIAGWKMEPDLKIYFLYFLLKMGIFQ